MNQRALAGCLVALLCLSLPLAAQTRADLSSVLQWLMPALPASEWQASQQPWTAKMVRQVAALWGEDAKAERATKGWVDGRSLLWVNQSQPGQQVALSVARHQNEAAARVHFGFSIDLQRKVDEQASKSCGPFMQVLETRSQSVSIPGVAEAVRTDKRIKIGEGQPTTVSTLMARFGDTFVECDWFGAPADMRWAEQLFAHLRK